MYRLEPARNLFFTWPVVVFMGKLGEREKLNNAQFCKSTPPQLAQLRNSPQPYENKLATFKVNELQAVLQCFKVQKVGKKNELYSRCVELLRTPNLTNNVIEKIREVETRLQQRPAPYPLPTMSNNYQQQRQQQNIYSQNGGGMNGYGTYGNLGLGQIGAMNMNINHQMHQMSNVTPRPARNLTVQALPFYDPILTLLEPTELPASVNAGGKMPAQVICVFTLSTEHHMRLSVEENRYPRTEVQLRFFNTTGDILHIEQPDDFPLNCAVKVNDLQVTLPNVIPTNKPNVEPKRPSRPVNITTYVINQPRDKQHRMRIDWTADKRQWAVGIYLVTRVDSNILRKRIVDTPSFELPYQTTEATIRKRLGGGDDDDVCMDTLKTSLLCPLMKTRMTIAARSRDCTHLQCFDLDSYLMLNEKKPAWKCGVCNNPAPYHRLIVDKYFMKMLTDLGPLVTDVELLKDGSYRVIKEDDCCDISDDDDDGPKPPKSVATATPSGSGGSTGGSRPSSNAGTGAPPATPTAASKKDDDIITISDDEEDMDLRNAIAASIPGTAACGIEPRTPIKACSDSSSDDSIIILDDTPPRPEQPASRSTAAAVSTSSSNGSAAGSSSWRPVASSSASTSGAAAAASTTTTSAASAAATATSSVAGGGGAASSSSSMSICSNQSQQPAAAARSLNLAEALNQAGHRAGLPGQLQLNVSSAGSTAPLSAALGGQQGSFYNWGTQQQPQSAPPMMQQQQQAQAAAAQGWQPYANLQWNTSANYPQFVNVQYDPRQVAASNGYAQQQQQAQQQPPAWIPPNAPPVYAPPGVIRRHQDDEPPRDPRAPR